MKKKRFNQTLVAHWHRFSRKSYSAYCSLKRVVAISVLSVSTLLSASAATPESVKTDRQLDEEAMHDDSAQDPLELREVEVVTQASSLSTGRPAQPVTIISGATIASEPVQTITDVLKYVSSIDVRQRGPNGIQSDINIDGGTHDQVTILLNGVDITSPQTGHYSGDWPVNVEDIDRIEILEGAASRVSGSSSLMGIINIITKPAKKKDLNLHVEGGSFLTFGASFSGNLPLGKVKNHLSGLWNRSDGGTTNSDYRRFQGFYQGGYESDLVDVDWQFGVSTLGFGANTFYSAAYPNQHDQVYRLITSVSAVFKTRVRIEPMVYWNRLGDHYQLVRDTHTGENFHRSDVVGGRLNASAQWVAGRSNLGVGVRYEHLYSSALGTPMDESKWIPVPGQDGAVYNKEVSRTAVNLFAEHNVRLGRFDLSAGLTASMNTGIDKKFRFYPGIDVSYRPTDNWRLTASWNRGYRMPTFTDLYYKSVVIEGNKDMKPERMQSWKITASYTNSFISAGIQGFYHQGRDMIDWVMYTPEDIYHSTNFNLDNYGFTVNARLDFQQLFGTNQPFRDLSVDYTQIHQKRFDNVEIYKSNYALEYLRHKIVISLRHRIIRNLEFSWDFRWVDRNGSYIEYQEGKSTGELHSYSPYAVLDLKINYLLNRWTFTAMANNLTNHRYYDFGNIPQPGIWMMLGVSVKI